MAKIKTFPDKIEAWVENELIYEHYFDPKNKLDNKLNRYSLARALWEMDLAIKKRAKVWIDGPGLSRR